MLADAEMGRNLVEGRGWTANAQLLERAPGDALGRLQWLDTVTYLPLDILTKPGRLTPQEFNLVKERPGAGYQVLKDIALPELAFVIAMPDLALSTAGRLEATQQLEQLLRSSLSTHPREWSLGAKAGESALDRASGDGRGARLRHPRVEQRPARDG